MVSIAIWRMIFWVLLPVVAVALALGLFGMRADTEKSRCDAVLFDAPGFALLALGFSAFVLGINEASASGWLGARTLMLLAAALALLAGFGVHATRAKAPVLSI